MSWKFMTTKALSQELPLITFAPGSPNSAQAQVSWTWECAAAVWTGTRGAPLGPGGTEECPALPEAWRPAALTPASLIVS